MIHYQSGHSAIRLAAQELASYLRTMTGRRQSIRRIGPEGRRGSGTFIECENAGGQDAGTDHFEVVARGSRIVLRGSRPRCCLYAVYAYLEAQGVRFLRPGPDGEVVPRRQRLKSGIRLRERASYDHRCVCHEGATSVEHALAMVDWMAKHRMNEFLLQFETSLPFWNRWYAHELNPRFPGRRGRITLQRSRQLDEAVIRALKKRDMDVQRMGHGWTSASLGVTAQGWSKTRRPITPRMRKRIALVDGKRDWYKGIPGNTQLCLSNTSAFNGLVDTVVRYAAAHTEADVILFCLADGMNQHCECARCRRLPVTDWYARLVNAISRVMAARGLKTKLSFDAYVDLLWPPKKHFIDERAGNLIFMYAPFFRCYEHAMTDPSCRADHPVRPWLRNRTPAITGNRAYVQLLRQWQAQCTADSCLCDYHFIRMHYYALDDWLVARRVHEDVADLMKLGMNGLFSCQVLRAFYPTGIGMAVMAATLWDRTVDLDSVIDDHLRASFGSFATGVRQYLEQVHRALMPAGNDHDHLMYWAKDRKRAADAEALFGQWTPRLDSMRRRAPSPVVSRSLDYLIHYNTLMPCVCRAAGAMADADVSTARRHLAEASDFICQTEPHTHWVLDAWNVNLWSEERLLRWRDGTKWFEKPESH